MNIGKILFCGLLFGLFVASKPVLAEDAQKAPGENASESGKNEIPVCASAVPIEVSLGSEVSASDRVEVINKYEVVKRVQHAIGCEIERQAYSADKSTKIKISITAFRLRSAGAAVVAGIMAGVDILRLSVDVEGAGSGQPVHFDTKTSGSRGGWHMPTESQRLNVMVQKLAKDVVAKMKKKGIFKEA